MFPREYVKLSGTYTVISPFFSLEENEDLKGVEAAKGTRGRRRRPRGPGLGLTQTCLIREPHHTHSAQPKTAVRTVPGLHCSRLSVALRPPLSLPPKSGWRRFLTPPQSEEPALRKFGAHPLEGTGALSKRRRPRVRVLSLCSSVPRPRRWFCPKGGRCKGKECTARSEWRRTRSQARVPHPNTHTAN